ncbi:MAG: CD225/dispanin family protein [Pyrinomonadaceae bacterium]|nr:CD225/dispanin family protein [Pyrinomonadaceae bacterium]
MSQQWTPPAPTTPGGQPPPNYLIPAILVTIFCCLPGGIVTIIYATQVNSKYQAGDIAGAEEASKKAKMWAMISAGVGLVVIVLVIILNVLGIAMSSNF